MDLSYTVKDLTATRQQKTGNTARRLGLQKLQELYSVSSVS